MKIIVTGGDGLVGRSLYTLTNDSQLKHEFIYLNKKDCDLRNDLHVDKLFNYYKPDIVIHLAAKVGGLFFNIDSNYNMFIDNNKINTNILEACKKYNIKRLINILSTCIYPDNTTYPLSSKNILNGKPHDSNSGYSHAKRFLYIGSQLLTNISDIHIVNLTPTNLYGFNDNFNLTSSHVLPALIHKTYIAKNNNSNLIIKGNGESLRQFVFSNDLAVIILFFIDCVLEKQFNELIIGPPIEHEISIKNLVNNIVSQFNFKGNVIYDTHYNNGQLKKTVDSTELLRYMPDFKFTPLDIGLKYTIKFFIENYNSLRV